MAVGSVFFLLYLNGAFSSWWLSWGPPSEVPKIWAHFALVRLGIALAIGITSIMLFVALGKNFQFRKSKLKFAWLCIVALGLGYPQASEFIRIDSCLDSGGSWKDSHFECIAN